ncbi:hypothetical protein [Anaerocolumna jejuensis]|uniref:hypothetical protein n=1 Tax=Anaerocolumna jejuensis TaxID=259063 RepID=UPI003F7C7935
MKVIDIVGKYRMCSNSDVFVQYGSTGDMLELTKANLKGLTPDSVMMMKVNGFDVIDNVLTIHVGSETKP